MPCPSLSKNWGKYSRLRKWPIYVGIWFLPQTPWAQSLNLTIGLETFVVLERHTVGELHAVGWGDPSKRYSEGSVVVVIIKNIFDYPYRSVTKFDGGKKSLRSRVKRLQSSSTKLYPFEYLLCKQNSQHFAKMKFAANKYGLFLR